MVAVGGAVAEATEGSAAEDIRPEGIITEDARKAEELETTIPAVEEAPVGETEEEPKPTEAAVMTMLPVSRGNWLPRLLLQSRALQSKPPGKILKQL